MGKHFFSPWSQPTNPSFLFDIPHGHTHSSFNYLERAFFPPLQEAGWGLVYCHNITTFPSLHSKDQITLLAALFWVKYKRQAPPELLPANNYLDTEGVSDVEELILNQSK